MRKVLLLSFLTTILLMLLCTCKLNEYKCIITGNTVGCRDTTLLMFKINEDPLLYGISIPVKDGIFKYKMTFKQPEAYYLMFEDGALRNLFFVEPGKVDLTIYPESELDRSIINQGGSLNMEYHAFKAKEDFTYLPLIKPIQDSTNLLWRSGRYLSDTIIWNSLEGRFSQLSNQKFSQRIDYIKNHQSLVSYYFLVDIISRFKDTRDYNIITDSYRRLAQQYPDHPYTELTSNIIESIRTIQVGGRYIDFVAPTLSGDFTKLSENIDDKVAVLSLWSTWCNSCINKNRLLVPVYEEFQERGLIIVGVVSDKELSRIMDRTKEEMHPWLTLVELDKQNQIWEKYGMENSGGGVFLIDRNGTIIAINPSADEIRKMIPELLK